MKTVEKDLINRAQEPERLRGNVREPVSHVIHTGLYLQKLNNSLHDAVFTVKLPERIIEYANSAVENQFGYPVETCIGKTTEFLYPEPDSYHEFAEVLTRAIDEKKDVLKTEKILRRQNGDTFVAEITATFIYINERASHVISIVRDISGLKIMERELKETLEKYKKVVEDQTEVISRFSPDGTFTFVNDTYCRYFGKKENELIGKKWHPVAHEDDLPEVNRQLKKMSKENPVITIENRVMDGMNRLRWMQFVNRGFFNKNGNIIEIQSVGRDVTIVKEKEEIILEREKRIKKQTDELNKVNSALEVLLERKNRQLDEFKSAFYRNFNDFVFPDLEKVKGRIDDSFSKKTISLIINNIKQMFLSDISSIASLQQSLTKSELTVAAMIRNGMSSSQISEHMNISDNTVSFHRKNIRKKLGIHKTGISLSEHLANLW